MLAFVFKHFGLCAYYTPYARSISPNSSFSSKKNIIKWHSLLSRPDYYGTYRHIGGADDFKKHTGFRYNSDDAIAEASKRNKAKLRNCTCYFNLDIFIAVFPPFFYNRFHIFW